MIRKSHAFAVVCAVALFEVAAVRNAAAAKSIPTTNLLFTFVTNQNGFDTGISIANTTADPFGTTQVSGTCTLNFFGANAPSSPFTTASVAAGTVFATLASTVAPGFQGYLIAQCNFPLAHGWGFVSDIGARNLAAGYLALVIVLATSSIR